MRVHHHQRCSNSCSVFQTLVFLIIGFYCWTTTPATIGTCLILMITKRICLRKITIMFFCMQAANASCTHSSLTLSRPLPFSSYSSKSSLLTALLFLLCSSKVLLIHICFQCLTKPNKRRLVKPRQKRPRAAIPVSDPSTASSDAHIPEKGISVPQTPFERKQSNSGIKSSKAIVSKTIWNMLMFLAVEGANA